MKPTWSQHEANIVPKEAKDPPGMIPGGFRFCLQVFVLCRSKYVNLPLALAVYGVGKPVLQKPLQQLGHRTLEPATEL